MQYLRIYSDLPLPRHVASARHAHRHWKVPGSLNAQRSQSQCALCKRLGEGGYLTVRLPRV